MVRRNKLSNIICEGCREIIDEGELIYIKKGKKKLSHSRKEIPTLYFHATNAICISKKVKKFFSNLEQQAQI